MFTILQLMSLKLSITTVLILVHGKFQEFIHFRLADPAPPPPPLDPGCHFDMMREYEKHINWRKGMLGPWGHT